MNKIQFTDMHGNTITLQHSSLATEAAFRIFIDTSESGIESQRREEETSVHLSRMQAEIIINGLQELIQSYER